MDEAVTIDGSVGEGGGQMLRTALMLSVATGTPFEAHRIRAGRPVPGLRPQHLSILEAFRDATGATVSGASIGSSRVGFRPGAECRKEFNIDVGTAGSVTMILGTLAPALSAAGWASKITVTGGTDTKWAPTFDYFARVVRPLYGSFGVMFDATLHRRGYYPTGLGKVSCEVKPAASVSAPTLSPVRPLVAGIASVCSCLPPTVAERQAASARRSLAEAGIESGEVSARVEDAVSPGTAALVFAEGSFLGGDAVGERRVSAEEVGARAASAFVACYRSGAALDLHAGDMALPIAALAEGRTSFSVPKLTGHMQSNIEVMKKFVKCGVEVKEAEGRVDVTVDSRGRR
ncbi:MAG: RNA 3'-terminal phosphate cyclase [Nitrososphaerota archaeon]|nr:RNA 3'-terminal phosphate cyclase [Nitrososphaerota archaeon]